MRHARLLESTFALLVMLATGAGAQAHWQTELTALPLTVSPDGKQIELALPGNVPLTMVRTGDDAFEYAMPAALTYRQWSTLLTPSRFEDSASMNPDAPIPDLSLEDLAGVKGFIPALETYRDKFPSAEASLKFGLTRDSVPGHYRIMATARRPKPLPPVSIEAACGFGNAQPFSCGQTKSGILSSTDCTLVDGSYADIYSFYGTAGQQVTLNLTSSAFDSYLILWDPSGQIAASDDDSGAGFNSRLTFNLTSTGTWYVGANSLAIGETGSYTLSMTCGDGVNECPIATISCGAQVAGSLATSDCLLNDGSYADLYKFAGTSGQVTTIDLTSSAFDTYLVLADPDGNVAVSDDDGGTGTNSRIVYTLTRSGDWILVANSLSGGVTGSYGLHLQCNTIPPCTYSLGSTSASVSSTGGTGTVQITGSPSGCTGSWTSQSNASWITMASNTTGTGAGTFTLLYTVTANPSSSARSGTLTIAGQTFTVNQSGSGSIASCVPGNTRACLLNGRFSATVRYRSGFDNGPADQNAFVKPVTGFATATSETVFFYFNSESNIEMMLKMLDQGNTNSQGQPTIALLFGSATPLRMELTITDTLKGGSRTYTSSFNSQQGMTDFAAFVK